jgi:hypothetical protein
MERLAIDLLAPELYGGDPYPTYAWMRANEPVFRDRNGLAAAATYGAAVSGCSTSRRLAESSSTTTST